MDTIFISDLRLDILIGVYDWEKQVPQKVQLDLEIGLPGRKAGSDKLGDTIDYAAVVSRIEAALADNRFGLLEALAEHIAGIVTKETSVVQVSPLGQPGFAAVLCCSPTETGVHGSRVESEKTRLVDCGFAAPAVGAVASVPGLLAQVPTRSGLPAAATPVESESVLVNTWCDAWLAFL